MDGPTTRSQEEDAAAAATPSELFQGHVVTGDAELDERLRLAAASFPNDHDGIARHARAARARAADLGHAAGHAYATAYLAGSHYMRSEYEPALRLFTEALTEMDPLGDLGGRAFVLSGLSNVQIGLGHYEDALEAAVDALQIVRALGDRHREAWLLSSLGNTYLELGEPDRALEAGERALEVFAGLGNVAGQARAHTAIGGARLGQGRLDAAREHHETALRLARESETALSEARALHDLGEVDTAAGDAASALARHREALRIRRDVGNRQAESTSLLRVGCSLVTLGRAAEARAPLEAALAIAVDVGSLPREAAVHEVLAKVAEAEGDPAGALAHLRRHQGLREALLGAQARSRIQTLQIRAEAERSRHDAEIAQLRSVELADANRELEGALDRLRAAQSQIIQQEKLESLGRLSTGLAHELQNPLNFIAGFSGVNAELADEAVAALREHAAALPAEVAATLLDDVQTLGDNARRVREHAARASGIVRSLAGHARTTSGRRERVDLRGLVARALDAALAGSGVTPVWAPGDAAVWVVADAQALDKAVLNLVDNARRAVADEAARLGDGFRPYVCLTLGADGGDAVLRVMDNGPGIPAEIRDRVFEPFFSTRPTGEGTGLGLPIAREIVDDGHGGALTLDATAAGSTFVLRLPLAPDA